MSFRAAAARTLLLFALVGGPVVAVGAAPALAQHVVTDNEAGKLTFDALTATPVAIVHRVAYRPMSRRSVYLPAAARVRMGSTSAVRTVAFKRLVHVSAATKAVVRHSRTRRG